MATAVVWVSALWETRGELRRQAARREADGPQPPAKEGETSDEPPADGTLDRTASDSGRLDVLFRQAQQRYLAGDWARAEQSLRELLRLDRDDIEAQLLLASVWRMAEQPERSRRQLQALERRQDAEGWRNEIEHELKLLGSDQPTEASGTKGDEPIPAETTTPPTDTNAAIAGRIGDNRLPAADQNAA